MKYLDYFETDFIPQSPVACCTLLPSNPKKTLYFLHGNQERYTDILAKSKLEIFAEQYHIAIVIPDFPDNYYQNQTWDLHDMKTSNTHCYTERFFIEELLPAIQEKYHLPTPKEDTLLAGISMGGFGSLLIGSHHPHLFGKIASISGAFIIDDLLDEEHNVIGGIQNLWHFYNLFGPIWELKSSTERNPLCAAQKALEQGTLPPIFLSCGTLDMLYKRNQKLYTNLLNLGANVTWSEAIGVHNWDCFGRILKEMINWIIQ